VLATSQDTTTEAPDLSTQASAVPPRLVATSEIIFHTYLFSINLHGKVSRQTINVRDKLFAISEYSINFRINSIRYNIDIVLVNGRFQ